jgi:glyoxylase-like metal-dependent hydrolase (beta-lactamase superfamily II)
VTLTHGLPAVYARIMAHLTGDGDGDGDGGGVVDGMGGEGKGQWRRRRRRRRRRSLALQDDYRFWAAHGERFVRLCLRVW